MTPATQSPTTDGRTSLTSAPESVPHAYVENGDLFILMGGRLRKTPRWDALFLLMQLEGSPYPSSQERARQIRAALKETMQ